MRARTLGALVLAACTSAPPASPGSACPGVCASAKLTRLDRLAGRPGGPGWVDGPLVAAHFSDPWAMARDGQGRIYVADGQTIRFVDPVAGTVSTVAGVYNRAGCSDGAGPSANFNAPSGLAFLGGQLYVTDTDDDTIRQINVGGGSVTTIAGACRQPGAVDAVGASARFLGPQGLVLDSTGQNLYVSDTENDTIRVLSLATGAVTTIAGLAKSTGNVDGIGGAASFYKPEALAIDAAGTLYVVDHRNQSVRHVSPGTGAVSTLATFAIPPRGVATDGSDVLVSLADHTIVRVSPGGAVTVLAGSSGAKGFVDGVGSAARFDSPAGLLDDGSGTVYVADEANAVLRTLALGTGAVGTYAGADPRGAVDGRGGQALFDGPQGIAADAEVAYVADTKNDTIRKVVLSSGVVTTLAGAAGQPGLADGSSGAARFNAPEGLALDGDAQQLYVADANNRSIRRVDLRAGAVSTLALSTAPHDPFSGFGQPAGLALDRGRLFVTDYANHAVLVVDLAQSQVSTFAGQFGVSGSADGQGAKAAFYGPFGIAADGVGNLYVADDLNDAVRKIVLATATVSTIAGQAAVPGNNDGNGARAHFYSPTGVAADAVGELFVSDTANNEVRRIDVASGKVTTVIGSLTVSGVRVGPLPAQITQPGPLALTPSGSLLLVSEDALLVAH